MRKITPSELLLDFFLVLFEESRGSADLSEAVGRLRGRDVPLATFYRQLQKAVDSGWVEMAEDSAERAGPGRPERLYRLTDEGERALRSGLEEQRRRIERAHAVGLLTERAQ